jgi:endonuclease/exonuclease/phosphatase family metal-dependent hydrolase
MKRALLPIILVAVFVAANTAGARTVRVATFNIENGPEAPDTTDYKASKAIVQRINADVVAFQEINRTSTNEWRQMAAELGYTNVQLGTTNSAGGLLGFFSRFPVQQVTNLSSVAPANEFTRRPMRVVVQVPGAVRPLVLWNMHHKADDGTPTNTPANSPT